MTDLIKYWPSKEEVSAVCGFQAEFMEEHILLSIHRKLKFDYINRIDPSRSEEKDEDFLINDFIKENSDNFQLTIVEGFSGVGKSHYIKWLQAKINSNDKFHIVWFRRNINLKEIFNLILEPFKEDPLFSDILVIIELLCV